MAATHEHILAKIDELASKATATDSRVQATLNFVLGIAHQINALGGQMSELDQSVGGLKQAVADLSTRLSNLPDQLAEIARLNDELTAARADDTTDDAKIAELEGQLGDAILDAQENVAEIQGVTSEVEGLAPAEPPVEPVP